MDQMLCAYLFYFECISPSSKGSQVLLMLEIGSMTFYFFLVWVQPVTGKSYFLGKVSKVKLLNFLER